MVLADVQQHGSCGRKLVAGNQSYILPTVHSEGLKASLHQSGKWHIAFSKHAFDKYVKGVKTKFDDRFVEKWFKPSELAPGITLAFRIVTPYSAITNSTEIGKYKGVKWLPNAPETKATEIDIFITKPEAPVTGWPGKKSMATSLIGSFPLENGATVWAVYWVIDLPDLSKWGDGVVRFFTGKNKEDLKKKGLRLIAFGKEPDGSRVMYDCSVENTPANNGMIVSR